MKNTEIARMLKEAADNIVARDKMIAIQEDTINTHIKKGSVNEIVQNMTDRGFISESAVDEKRAELMDEPDLDAYSRALSDISGTATDIGIPEKKAGAGDAFDAWLFGG